MRLIVCLSATLMLTLSSSARADDSAPESTLKQAADTPTTAEAKQPVSEDAAEAPPATDVAETAMPAQVQPSTNVCPRCGRIHGTQPGQVRTTQQQQRIQSAGVFDRIMEVERRKNAWLRSMWR